MTSTDTEILLDIQAEQARQREEQSQFQAVVLKRLDAIERELIIIKHEQANLQTSVYWTLGAIGIFLAGLVLPSIVASITSAFRKLSESKDSGMKLIASLFRELLDKRQDS